MLRAPRRSRLPSGAVRDRVPTPVLAPQAQENFRSTERQYALAEEATRLGWAAERIMVMDGIWISGRLGHAGAEGIRELVARVCLGEVGAIRAGGREAGAVERRAAAAARVCALTDTLSST